MGYGYGSVWLECDRCGNQYLGTPKEEVEAFHYICPTCLRDEEEARAEYQREQAAERRRLEEEDKA